MAGNFASSNLVSRRYVKETTFGVTPTNPAFKELRTTGGDFNANVTTTTSNEIRSDRMTADIVPVGEEASGEVPFEFSAVAFDDLIEGAMYSNWITSGTGVTAVTDIAAVSLGNKFTSTVTDFTTAGKGFVVGRWVKITGGANEGFARIVSRTASEMVVDGLDLVDDAAGDSITIDPLDYIRTGTTRQSFTFQREFGGIDSPEYENYAGSRISTMSLKMAFGEILTGSFGVLSKSGDAVATQFTGATFTAAATKDVMNGTSNVRKVIQDGAASEVEYQSLDINLDNKLRRQNAIGDMAAKGIAEGEVGITGSFMAYYENGNLARKIKANTSMSVSFTASDNDGNTYIFTFPKVKLTKVENQAGSKDSDVMISAEFGAIRDATTGSMFQIDRYLAA